MGIRAHVQTKRVIEYGNCHFNYAQNTIYWWLVDNGVDVYTDDDRGENSNEWQIDKSSLKNIPNSAYKSLDEDDEISADDLREFVKDMLEAATDEYAYVSWF